MSKHGTSTKFSQSVTAAASLFFFVVLGIVVFTGIQSNQSHWPFGGWIYMIYIWQVTVPIALIAIVVTLVCAVKLMQAKKRDATRYEKRWAIVALMSSLVVVTSPITGSMLLTASVNGGEKVAVERLLSSFTIADFERAMRDCNVADVQAYTLSYRLDSGDDAIFDVSIDRTPGAPTMYFAYSQRDELENIFSEYITECVEKRNNWDVSPGDEYYYNPSFGRTPESRQM